jgi:hypothetical protein
MRKFGEDQIYKLVGYLVFVHLIALVIAGCDPTVVSSEKVTTGAGVGMDAGHTGNIGFQLLRFKGLPSESDTEAPSILIEARDAVTGHISLTIAPSDMETFALDLTGLSLPVSITAFVDLNSTQRIERCPSPAQSGQVITDTQYDLWVAETRLSRAEATPLELDFRRSLCGPGTSATSWSGNIDISNTPARAGSDLLVHLKSIHDDGNAIFETILSVSSVDDDSIDPLNINIDALLPGRHELRIFWDDDHDLNYSPCIAEKIGGGDLGFSELVTFEIVEGETLQAASTITLQPSTCADSTTTVSASVDLSALTNTNPRKLSGKLLVEVSNASETTRLYVREINRGHLLRPSFTITNLPVAALDLRVYIDRNDDEVLFSCAADQDGQDLFSARTTSISLMSSAHQDLGTIVVDAHDCPLERLSNIAIEFTMDAAGARKESPRPVYVSVANEETNDITMLKVSENHLEAGQSFALKQILAPGNYNLFAFVDTEEDATFTHCEHDAFGDRARTELFRFQLSEYELFEAPPLPINRSGCDFPTVQFNLNVNMEVTPLSISQMKLVISLKEAGGLTESLIFEVPPVEPPWFFPVSDLVPGSYEVTVHLDQNGDRRLNECSEVELRELVGFQTFVLDRNRPFLDASIELVDPCVNMDSTNDE